MKPELHVRFKPSSKIRGGGRDTWDRMKISWAKLSRAKLGRPSRKRSLPPIWRNINESRSRSYAEGRSGGVALTADG